MGRYYIEHSAKGSTWKKHKYIKIANGLYFYPDDYVGGRHIGNKKKTSNKKEETKTNKKKTTKEKTSKAATSKSKDKEDNKKKGLTSKKVEKLAQDVIRGNYGVGQERIDKLGKKYNKVQYRVNQILLGNAGATRIWNRDHPGKSEPGTVKKKTATTKKKTSSTSTSRKRKK